VNQKLLSFQIKDFLCTDYVLTYSHEYKFEQKNEKR
jgi:hypothetical protein